MVEPTERTRPAFPQARPVSTGAGVFEESAPPAELLALETDPDDMPVLTSMFAFVDQVHPEESGVVLTDTHGGTVRTSLGALYSAFTSLFRTNPVVTDQLPIAEQDRDMVELAKVLLHLDRCQHGRHEGDTCAGWSSQTPHAGCRGGRSLGNPYVGVRVGADLYGQPLFLPATTQLRDPQAWRRWPSPPPDHIRELDDAEVTRAYGDIAMVPIGRATGMHWYRRGYLVMGFSGTGDDARLVSVVQVDDDGRGTGPPVAIVHELTDEQIAARDATRVPAPTDAGTTSDGADG